MHEIILYTVHGTMGTDGENKRSAGDGLIPVWIIWYKWSYSIIIADLYGNPKNSQYIQAYA